MKTAFSQKGILTNKKVFYIYSTGKLCGDFD